MQDMPRKTDTKAESGDSVLVKAATTIGKSMGKLARFVSRKTTTQSQTPEKPKPARKKKQTTSRKKVAAGKTGASRKLKKTVRSGSTKRKPKT
jgi:hypothetical protein